jgi:ABC-type multidrug transport system permease subunit
MFFMVMADPTGDVGYWTMAVYFLQFAAYGIGYFYSLFMDQDKALVVSVVTAVAFSVTSGLSPKLTSIDNYQPLPFFWTLSYCRWGAEALYLISVGEQTERVSMMTKDAGYNPDNLKLDIGMLVIIGILYRIVTYVTMLIVIRKKSK